MKFNMLKEIDYVYDSITFLKKLQSNESYIELKEKLENKYSFTEEKKYFDKVIEISDFIYSKINIDMNKVQKYFSKIINDISMADIIMMMNENIEVITLEERYKYILSKTNEEKMSGILKGYFIGELEDETLGILNVKSEKEFFEFIDKSDIDIKEKWRIESIYYRFDEYAKDIYEILTEVIKVFSKYEKDISLLLREFSKKWQRIFNNNPEEFLNKFMNFNIEDSTRNCNVVLSIADCNSISFRSYDKHENEGDYKLVIGLIINESCNMGIKYKNPANIYRDLKVISDKSKFDILLSIKEKTAYGQELANKFKLSKPTISHHMSALHEAAFVKIKKKENRLYYSMDKENIEKFLDELRHILIE